MKKLLLVCLVLGSYSTCEAYTNQRTRSHSEDFRPLFWAAPTMVGARALRDCYARFADTSLLQGSVKVGKEFVERGIAAPYNRHDRLHFDDAAEIALNSVLGVLLAPLVLTCGAAIKTGQGVASAVHAVAQTPVQQVAVIAASAAVAGYCMYKLHKGVKVEEEEE